MRRGLRRTLAILAVAIVGLGVLAGVRYQSFVSSPLEVEGEDVRLEVVAGSSVRGIARELERRGIADSAELFVWMTRLRGEAHAIQAGEYRLEPGITPRALLDKLVAGEVIQHRLTLVEGWTFRELMAAVNAHPEIEHTVDDLGPEEVMARLGRPDEHPEGRFYPDTYRFPGGTPDVDILERAYRAMEQRLAEEWAQRDPDLPLDSPYEALILASIVERETAAPGERARIAGVFVRRLERGMRLQTDPTVIYGMGDAFDGDIRYRDLREDTPYNTYRRAGLPPTPIAIPGGASIHATLHPAEGDALYFVSRGDGSHQFSATLEEHQRAVRRYQLGQTQQQSD